MDVPMYYPLTKCGAYDALGCYFCGFGKHTPTVPTAWDLNCVLLRYAYADILESHFTATVGSLAYPFLG